MESVCCSTSLSKDPYKGMLSQALERPKARSVPLAAVELGLLKGQ